MNEDKRTAVGISVTLSGQLMSAALAVIAVEAGFVSYVLANRTAEWFYYLVSIIAFIFFVASLYFGGTGINDARNAGFNGEWDLGKGKNQFNTQAILCLIGLLLLFLSLFLSGKSKADDVTTDIKRLSEAVSSLRQEVQDQRKIGEGTLQDLKAIHLFDGTVSEQLLKIQDELAKINRRVSRVSQAKGTDCK